MNPRIYVGCATWAIGAKNDHLLPPAREGNLARYATRLTAAEINSSFHRSHRLTTWARWARSVGPSFRFSVKAPKQITHERRLDAVGPLLTAFDAEVSMLGEKLGPVLVQLPPSLAFDEALLREFLGSIESVRRVVLEPRHASWFTDEVDALLSDHEVARVAADPAVVPRAAEPGGGRVCATSGSTVRRSRTARPTTTRSSTTSRHSSARATGASSTTPPRVRRLATRSRCSLG